jgi:hypothetical protein
MFASSCLTGASQTKCRPKVSTSKVSDQIPVNFREDSVHFREYSVNFREHSLHFREYSVNFREHSVLLVARMNDVREFMSDRCIPNKMQTKVRRFVRPKSQTKFQSTSGKIQSTLGNIQSTSGNIHSTLGNIQSTSGNIQSF